jgi:hypothetical protein
MASDRQFIDIRAPHCIAYGADKTATEQVKRMAGGRPAGAKSTTEQRKAASKN